jgi:para-nitrobenzyl esterase
MYLDDSAESLNKTIDSYPEETQVLFRERASQEKTNTRGHDQISTMVDMVCPGYLYAQQIEKSGKNAYLYRFKRVRSGSGGDALQAYHGAEIPYVFNTHDDWFSTNEDDIRLTLAMMNYWTNFARNGNPNDDKSVTWPVFNKNAPQVIALSENISAIPAPDYSMCQTISPYLKTKNNKTHGE